MGRTKLYYSWLLMNYNRIFLIDFFWLNEAVSVSRPNIYHFLVNGPPPTFLCGVEDPDKILIYSLIQVICILHLSTEGFAINIVQRFKGNCLPKMFTYNNNNCPNLTLNYNLILLDEILSNIKKKLYLHIVTISFMY